jgi:hypothetical protein
VKIAWACGAALAVQLLGGRIVFAANPDFQGFKTGTEVVREGDWKERWPFSIDAGDLTCIQFAGQRYVFFAEILPANTQKPVWEARNVAVSTNPFALFATYEHRDLYLPFDTLETLIKRLAPMEAHGTTLCDKGPGETAN